MRVYVRSVSSFGGVSDGTKLQRAQLGNAVLAQRLAELRELSRLVQRHL